MRRIFNYGRDKADPEKAVLPAIVFINTGHSAFEGLNVRGFVLIFGWWDYSFSIGLLLIHPSNPSASSTTESPKAAR